MHILFASYQKCRVCGRKGKQTGLLFRCEALSCGAAHWDKRKVNKLLRQSNETLQKILDVAEVPLVLKSESSHYVYVLRLKGEPNAVYVGMTGLHPYARYLNHIIGHKSSKHTKRRATALIFFEGPMTRENAAKREPELADELRESGQVVYGGH
jgi:predicted GIY-YIG superfamily endonuclease